MPQPVLLIRHGQSQWNLRKPLHRLVGYRRSPSGVADTIAAREPDEGEGHCSRHLSFHLGPVARDQDAEPGARGDGPALAPRHQGLAPSTSAARWYHRVRARSRSREAWRRSGQDLAPAPIPRRSKRARRGTCRPTRATPASPSLRPKASRTRSSACCPIAEAAIVPEPASGKTVARSRRTATASARSSSISQELRYDITAQHPDRPADRLWFERRSDRARALLFSERRTAPAESRYAAGTLKRPLSRSAGKTARTCAAFLLAERDRPVAPVDKHRPG